MVLVMILPSPPSRFASGILPPLLEERGQDAPLVRLGGEGLHINPGTYEVDWPACRSCGAGRDATNYPSGVYYYSLTAREIILKLRRWYL
jgi:hypothetical protein